AKLTANSPAPPSSTGQILAPARRWTCRTSRGFLAKIGPRAIIYAPEGTSMQPSLILKNKLYVGSCPMTEGDVIQLKDTGITAVLNLQTDEDIRTREIDWPAMEDAYRRHGIVIHRFPIEDFSPSDMRQKLRTGVRILDNLIRAGLVVYLHCNAGINRSPTL